MTCRLRLILASAAPAIALALVSPAYAQDPEPIAPPPTTPADVPAPPPVRLAEAPDDLTGHFIIAPRAVWLVPMGSFDSLTSQSGPVGTGLGGGLDLGYGISRYVDVHARADFGLLGKGSECPGTADCSAQTTSFGLGVGYHLVNGAAFDPWLQIGIGYRTIKVSVDKEEASYSGIDWLHLAVGGEWYGTRKFGFGPYFAFDLGSYSSRPAASERAAETAVHSFMSLGLRGVFDPMR